MKEREAEQDSIYHSKVFIFVPEGAGEQLGVLVDFNKSDPEIWQCEINTRIPEDCIINCKNMEKFALESGEKILDDFVESKYPDENIFELIMTFTNVQDLIMNELYQEIRHKMEKTFNKELITKFNGYLERIIEIETEEIRRISDDETSQYRFLGEQLIIKNLSDSN